MESLLEARATPAEIPREPQPTIIGSGKHWGDYRNVREHPRELALSRKKYDNITIAKGVPSGNLIAPALDEVDVCQILVVIIRAVAEQHLMPVIWVLVAPVYCVRFGSNS